MPSLAFRFRRSVHAAAQGSHRRLLIPAALLLAFAAAPAFAQVSITAEPVDCLPVDDNGVAWAKVEGTTSEQSVRLYFRRLNDVVEDLYWVDMQPAGGGRLWGVFPVPEDEGLKRHDIEERRRQAQSEVSWAEWWRQKDTSDNRDPNQELDSELIRERASQGKQVERHWLAELDDQTFQNWLERLENEPAEYYVAVTEPGGREVARSKTRVAEVRSNCRPNLSPEQRGEADNLTIGETAYWQRDEAPFHWQCDGIVTRVDPANVKRGDEACRACVVAWWKKTGFILPAALVAGTVAGFEIFDDSPPAPASPITP